MVLTNKVTNRLAEQLTEHILAERHTCYDMKTLDRVSSATVSMINSFEHMDVFIAIANVCVCVMNGSNVVNLVKQSVVMMASLAKQHSYYSTTI